MGFALLSFPDSAYEDAGQHWQIYRSQVRLDSIKGASQVATLLATTLPFAPRVVSDKQHTPEIFRYLTILMSLEKRGFGVFVDLGCRVAQIECV